jgi:hypothetical protein
MALYLFIIIVIIIQVRKRSWTYYCKMKVDLVERYTLSYFTLACTTICERITELRWKELHTDVALSRTDNSGFEAISNNWLQSCKLKYHFRTVILHQR